MKEEAYKGRVKMKPCLDKTAVTILLVRLAVVLLILTVFVRQQYFGG